MQMISCNCNWCGKSLTRKPQSKAACVRVHYCDNACKAEWQRTQKPVTKEWLYEHYVTRGLDTTQIGLMVSRDPKSVWNWLKDFGIPRRPRGSYSAHWMKSGEPSPFLGRKHSESTKKRLSEIAKADGRVPFDPKVGPYMRGRKGAQTTNWKGGVTPERQAFYATPEWKAAMKAVWERDDATCQRCGCRNQKGKRYTFDVHHVVSFACRHLRSDPNNLVLLCEKCHYWVHSNENVASLFIKEIPSVSA